MTNLDKSQIREFWARRAKLTDSRLATHFKHDDALLYDVEFVRRHLPPDARILDLGCGTGAMVQALRPQASFIRAVDQEEKFVERVVVDEVVSTQVADVVGYRDSNQYDAILVFGVLNYLSDHDARILYENCQAMLAPKGVLIVKNACGVHEDVVVNHYSEEIGDWYHALYRFYWRELGLLEERFEVEVNDIYPRHLNRWRDTHYYAFVGRHPALGADRRPTNVEGQ